MSSPLLIRNAKIITCDGDNTVAEAVALRGNKIEAVGPAYFLASDYGDARIIDAGGRRLSLCRH